MPDYDVWDLTNDFTVAQASCLWCEVDPGISFLIQKSKNPQIAAIEQMLVSEIKAGRLRADSTQNPLSSIGDYSRSLVSREALKELAEGKGVTPKFLFPSARQPSSEVQAAERLAPNEGSAPTREIAPFPPEQQYAEDGEIDFIPSGYIGLPGAGHAIWGALHGDAMHRPIPFWREERRDGKTVQIPTPEAAEEHKRIGRAQSSEAEEMLLGGLAGRQLSAEAEGPNGTKRFTVPIWYWQSDRAHMTISTGLLDLPSGPHSQFHLRPCFIRREAFDEWLKNIVGGVGMEAARVATGDGKPRSRTSTKLGAGTSSLRKFSEAKLAKWYREYVKICVRGGEIGAVAMYTSFDQKIALDTPGADGQFQIDVDGWSGLFYGGLLYQITQQTSVGVVYRSESNVDVSGDGVFSGLPVTLPVLDLELEWDTPQSVQVGVQHAFSPSWIVGLDFAWEDWSVFSENQVSASFSGGVGISTTIDRNWMDSYAGEISVTHIDGQNVYNVGLSYVTSVVDDGDRTIDLPLDDSFVVSLAAARNESENLTYGIGAAIIFNGDAEVDQTAQGTRFAGEFDTNIIFAIGASLQWRF